MFEYTIRRLLLMIPTFLGTTLLVFTILQIAPDGPFERAVRQLKQAQGAESESGSDGSSSILDSTGELTPELLDKLRAQYGLDKPIIVRYLIWVGIWPKEYKIKSVTLNEPSRETIESVKIDKYKEEYSCDDCCYCEIHRPYGRSLSKPQTSDEQSFKVASNRYSSFDVVGTAD